MLICYKAFLLKKIKYGDHHFILQTFTREEGLVSFFFRRKTKTGKVKIALEPLCFLNIVASKGRGDLCSIREVSNENTYHNLTGNIYKSSIVLFVNEVLLKTLKIHDSEPYLFDYLVEFIRSLDQAETNFQNYPLIFLVSLSEHLGFYPNGKYSDDREVFDLIEGTYCETQPLHNHFIKGNPSMIFSQLLTCELQNSASLRFTNQERRIMLDLFLDYYKIHVDQFDDLKSRTVLEAILA